MKKIFKNMFYTEEKLFKKIRNGLLVAKRKGILSFDVDVEKVASVKAKLMAGTYDDKGKFDALINNIVEELIHKENCQKGGLT